MDILEAIERRRSVRSFDGTGLSENEISRLKEAVGHTESPFGGKVAIRLKSFDLSKGYKPSTYGMIKGAVDFFLIGMGSDEDSALSAGFRFEQVVLRAQEMGLGTCWIAATFKGSDFERDESFPSGEELRIVSPVGHPAPQRMVEKVARFVVGSKNRKAFSDLFFTDGFSRPLSPDSRFGEALEMLRLAPSSATPSPGECLPKAILSISTISRKARCRFSIAE